jgi:hypothetical protein
MTTNTAPYTPRPGSKAEAAFVALTESPWLSRLALANAIDTPITSLDANLKAAVEHGALRKVAHDGVAGYMLAGDTAPPDDDAPAPKKALQQPRRKPLRKAAPAVRAQQPKPAKANGHEAAPAEDDDGIIAVLEDGRVAVFAGDSVAHMLAPRMVRRIIDLVQRLSVKP